MTNLQKVLLYFKDYESPERFIVWNYLYTISSCLGRKVYFQKETPLYPNIFVVIVGPPAIGKSMPARKFSSLLSSLTKLDEKNNITELVKIVPDCVTLERLYEVLEKSTDCIKIPGENPKLHTSVSFLLEDEMALLFKNGDKTNDLTMFLNAGYDCKEKFKYETKRNGINMVVNMCINFLGCCTPSWITRNISSSLIDDGWASRVFFIYGEHRRKLTTFFTFDKSQTDALESIKEHCKKIARISGEVTFSAEASELFNDWYQNRQFKERINRDPKLDTYYGRKRGHIWKLAMLCHFMEKDNMVIDAEDMKMAFAVAADAEMDMHKALASVHVNPAARLAAKVYASIKSAPDGMTKIQIIARHYEDIITGDIRTIDEVLNYLMTVEQIKLIGNKYVAILDKIVPFPVSGEDEKREAIN